MEYVPGGVDSGFTKMEKDVFRTRLLHVKGKRVVRVSEVRCAVPDFGLSLLLGVFSCVMVHLPCV